MNHILIKMRATRLLGLAGLVIASTLVSGCDTMMQNDMYNIMEGATHPETWQLPAVPVRVINQNQGGMIDSPTTRTNIVAAIVRQEQACHKNVCLSAVPSS